VPDALAIYAAAVGTGSIGWQIYRELRRLKTDIRVEFEHASESRQVFVAFGADTDPRPHPLEYELSIVVVNDGETQEFIRDVGLEQAAGGTGHDFGEGRTGDRELPPRGRFVEQIRVGHVDFDFSSGFRATARLASGRVIQSDVTHLDRRLLAHIEEWNRTARP
jgi:hypothetical protein